MQTLERTLTAIVLIAAGVVGLSSSVSHAKSMTVTNDADVGAGSLRDAIVQANVDASIDSIFIMNDVDTIEIGSAVEYTGVQDLSVDGRGATIRATDTFADVGMVISSNGANLSLSRLIIDGDFEGGEMAANGVFIPVPADQDGELSVFLKDVSVVNNGLFGLHIADQIGDSDVTLRLTVLDCLVANNGIGELDFDGIRVDDGGHGDIIARIVNSQIYGNGGDGLELDERGDGIVDLDVVGSSFYGNGFFDGEDLEDGLDIGEAGDGGIRATIVNVTLNDNFDEGLSLDEESAGDIDVSLVNVNADNNIDEGIKISEEDGGDLFALLRNVTAIGSEDEDGVHLEELDMGSVDVTVVNLIATDNTRFGLKLGQETDVGDTGILKLRNSTLEPNGDGDLDLDGVILTEEQDNDGDGDGVTPSDGDCDDNDATVYPGAPELYDGKDNDCDGVIPAIEDCPNKASIDTDSSSTAYTVGGTVIDYTVWAEDDCGSNTYDDYCTGTVVNEYGASGSGYVGPSAYDCQNYESLYCSGQYLYTDEWSCYGSPGYCSADAADTLFQDCGNDECLGFCGISTNGCMYYDRGCSSSSCYSNGYDCDSDSTYCSGCGLVWNIGGEVDPTACCGDDSDEYPTTCVDSTANGNCGADTAACCFAGTDCVDHNGNCQNQGGCYLFGSLLSFCDDNIWQDPDEHSVYCTASGCDFAWNLGGEVSPTACCGDDSDEYPTTCVDSTANGNCGADTAACCFAGTDCVDHNGNCQNQGGCYLFGSLLSFCDNNTWQDPDEHSAYCTASGCDFAWNIGGEVDPTACCGDDSDEYPTTCVDSTANGNCGADTAACCSASDDCVDHNGDCQTSGGYYMFGTGYAYCNQGIWDDQGG